MSFCRFCLLLVLGFLSRSVPAQEKANGSVDAQVETYARLSGDLRNTNADSSYLLADKAFTLAEKQGSDYSKLLANYAMGHAQAVKARYRTALNYFEQCKLLNEKVKNDSMLGNTYGAIGTILWQLGKHAESLEIQFKALALREKIKDRDGLIASRINIGMVYQSQDKLPQAESYVREALDLLTGYKSSISTRLHITALHTLANIYGMQGKIKEALLLDSTGIQLSEETNNEFSKAMFYDNMGNCYLYGDPPDYQKSFEYFRKTILIDSAFDNKKQMSDSYLNLGHLFITQKKYNIAIGYLQRSVALADSAGYAQGRQQAYQYMSLAYKKAGDIALAYEALQKSESLKDSLLNIESETKIAELQTIYETEKKQKQIELQQAQLSKKNYIITGTILILLLASLSGYLYYRRYRLRQKNQLQKEIMHQQEIATRAVMEAEESERQRIAKDLHDGVGQMMSAAKMNLSAFESEWRIDNHEQKKSLDKIISLVDESCREVRAVSHHMMPNVLLKKGLASAIGEFLEKIDSKVLKVHLHTEGLQDRIDSNVEIVLYRVIQECVNNVIKHAQASHLDISIIRDGDGISATIEDNGRGFDPADESKNEGMGLKNIRTRVEFLKGTVDFDSSPGKGTLVAVHVPLS